MNAHVSSYKHFYMHDSCMTVFLQTAITVLLLYTKSWEVHKGEVRRLAGKRFEHKPHAHLSNEANRLGPIRAFTKYKSDDLTQFVFATEADLLGPKCVASLNKHAT